MQSALVSACMGLFSLKTPGSRILLAASSSSRAVSCSSYEGSKVQNDLSCHSGRLLLRTDVQDEKGTAGKLGLVSWRSMSLAVFLQGIISCHLSECVIRDPSVSSMRQKNSTSSVWEPLGLTIQATGDASYPWAAHLLPSIYRMSISS